MNTTDRAPQIAEAVAALRRGEVIGMPTETVYGLAADGSSVAAVARIFALKGRPADHPLIVHIADAGELERWAASVPASAAALAEAFWPGPLTMILRRHPRVPDEVTGGQDTVGVRCPGHPLALQLLREFGGGLAAPSANRFGRLSPTTAAHVRDEFGAAVPIVLDGGECDVGIESTIIDLSSGEPRILRPGRVTHAQVQSVIGAVAEDFSTLSPRASGTLEAHYAPHTPMLMLPRPAMLKEAAEQLTFGKRVALLALDQLPAQGVGQVLPSEPIAYAHGLYAALRELDGRGYQLLLVERPPEGPGWLAIHDRLRRAAAGAGPDDDTP